MSSSHTPCPRRPRLSVNINKLATLRNSRGKNNPDLLRTCRHIIGFGAQGITVHPRPDERHIRRSDVYELRPVVSSAGIEFNIEGFPSEDFLGLVTDVVADQCTLVPDPPEALTSNAGWCVREQEPLLRTATRRLSEKGIRTSVFIDPRTVTGADFELMKKIGVDRVELYTEEYAETYKTARHHEVVAAFRWAADQALAHGIGVNAGHDLSLVNLKGLIDAIPEIDEVSIGHALICDALYLGLEKTISLYLECLSPAEKR